MQKSLLFLGTRIWNFQSDTNPEAQLRDVEKYFHFILKNGEKYGYTVQVMYVLNANLYWETNEIEEGYTALGQALQFITDLNETIGHNPGDPLARIACAFEFSTCFSMMIKESGKSFEMLFDEKTDFVRECLGRPEIFKENAIITGERAIDLLESPDFSNYSDYQPQGTKISLEGLGEEGFAVKLDAQNNPV